MLTLFPAIMLHFFFGLAAVVYMANRRLGLIALGWTVLLNAARMYLGFHYPSDVLGGAALGLLTVWAFQSIDTGALGRRILEFERKATPAFYTVSFLVSYEIAMLFDDIRGMASQLHQLIR